jgi:Ulp1 family protease
LNIDNNHWIVAKIDMKKRIICFYDSLLNKQKNLTESHKDLFNKIKDWLLIDEYNNIMKRKDVEDWNLVLEKTTRQQTNSVDCGIFAMINAFFVPDDFIITKHEKIAIIDSLRIKIGMDFERGYLKDPRIKNNMDYLSLQKSNVFGGTPKTIQTKTNFDPSTQPKSECMLDCYLPPQQSKKRKYSNNSVSNNGIIIIDLDDEEEEEEAEENEIIGEDATAIKMLQDRINKQKKELEINLEKLNSLVKFSK